MTPDPLVPILLTRGEQLLAEADALIDGQPLWWKIWNARRAKELTSAAEDLMDEARLRMGLPPDHDGQPDRFGPFNRTQLICLQWFFGLWNALAAVWAVVDGRWLSAVFSLLCMFVTTLWVLPRKPRKTHL